MRFNITGNHPAKTRVQFGAAGHLHVPLEIADRARNQTQTLNTYRSRCNTTALVQSRSSLYLQAHSDCCLASNTSAETSAPARPIQSPLRFAPGFIVVEYSRRTAWNVACCLRSARLSMDDLIRKAANTPPTTISRHAISLLFIIVP